MAVVGLRSHMYNTDSELLQAIRRPETRQNAFAWLVKVHTPRVYAHARHMCGNHDDACDVTQQVFIKVWQHIDTFRQQAALSTWIYRIATNESLNWLESTHRKNTQHLDHEQHASNFEHDAIDAEEIQRRLEKALQTLPARQKQVFLLRYQDEMPYEEMSELLGLSEGALKASYHHALKKIEQILKNH